MENNQTFNERQAADDSHMPQMVPVVLAVMAGMFFYFVATSSALHEPVKLNAQSSWAQFAEQHHCRQHAIRDERTEYLCDKDMRVEFGDTPPPQYVLDRLYK